ncbi:hypothetical protein [Paenarthrobacter sp. NPDC058040]|uniref:hypothetical protein n=1 Tax=unclassified Paenarthrobacter TaxID=2634190 RepID=UPI0036D875B9
MAGPQRALYYSRVRATLVPRIIGLVVAGSTPLLCLAAVLRNETQALFVVPLVVAMGLLAAYMSVTVKVDHENVVITFCNVFKQALPRRGIATVTTDKTAVPSGYGLRYLGPRTWGYVVGGPEITIEMTNGKTIIASTTDPEALIQVLTQ